MIFFKINEKLKIEIHANRRNENKFIFKDTELRLNKDAANASGELIASHPRTNTIREFIRGNIEKVS